ncbi:1713_t:CDS:1 [Ambispora leptoticha]|uniref:1713_t:CDS:1 n=1 Tax=Ambispora leptoticha TaxID=144679 RepID=A0A9N9BRD5_9GLOM|nr:1713_t:CDS:1 [Ambispora leptoticha]
MYNPVPLIIDTKFNKSSTKPESIRPGYDLKYVMDHLVKYGSYNYHRIENMCKMEKQYDDLSIINPGETPQQWAIHVKDEVQKLRSRGVYSIYHTQCLFASSGQGTIKTFYINHEEYMNHISYRRPQIHKSNVALCFECWRVVTVDRDIKTEKQYTTSRRRKIEIEVVLPLTFKHKCMKPSPIPPKPYNIKPTCPPYHDYTNRSLLD